MQEDMRLSKDLYKNNLTVSVSDPVDPLSKKKVYSIYSSVWFCNSRDLEMICRSVFILPISGAFQIKWFNICDQAAKSSHTTIVYV